MTNPKKASPHLPLLQAMFPQKLMLSADEVARVLGWAVTSLRANLSGPTPILRTVKVGGRRMMFVVAVAQYLDALLANQSAAPQCSVVGPRPTKARNPRASAPSPAVPDNGSATQNAHPTRSQKPSRRAAAWEAAHADTVRAQTARRVQRHRQKDPDQYRKYMRDLTRKKRAATAKNSAARGK